MNILFSTTQVEANKRHIFAKYGEKCGTYYFSISLKLPLDIGIGQTMQCPVRGWLDTCTSGSLADTWASAGKHQYNRLFTCKLKQLFCKARWTRFI